MNRRASILLLLFFSIILIGCGSKEQKTFITPQNDTISSKYLIADGDFGGIHKGATASKLSDVYGDTNVKLLYNDEIKSASDSVQLNFSYYVYDNSGKLLFTASAAGKKDDDPIIEQITIKDGRFTTKRGVSINSKVGEIVSSYPNTSAIQVDKDRVFLFVPTEDAYFMVDTSDVRGYDSQFIADIAIDSVNKDASIINMTISWYSQDATVFSGKFWRDLTRKSVNWIVTELPALVIMIMVFVALLRLIKFTTQRLRNIAIKHATEDDTIDTSEATKRIETLAGISHGTGKILLWTIFLLMFLAQININIAPILASAGIVGLAVGFGAQELVRDFISGFFILLEDQFRTGDMVIINDTMGAVEKIELRTVTLRDTAGVVHIFQNGKINSLSNMTKEWSAIVVEIGVAYKEDIDHVMEVMKRVGSQMKRTKEYSHLMLEEVNVLGVDQFADSAVVIKLILKTRPMQQWLIKREYLRRIKIEFDKEGIEIPFPHLSIYRGEDSKPFDIELNNKK